MPDNAILNDAAPVSPGAARALIEIIDVQIHGFDNTALIAGHIDLPAVGEERDVHTLRLAGWTVGRISPVDHIEIYHERALIASLPLRYPRPDLRTALGIESTATFDGFDGTIGMIGVTREFRLVLQAVLADGAHIEIGVIHGRREQVASVPQASLQALIVTAIGRSGTTVLMRSLSEHPGIVAHRAYPYETRYSQYWAHLLQVLTTPIPEDLLEPVAGGAPDRHALPPPPFYAPAVTNDLHLRWWLGTLYPEQIAAFCRQSIDAFYQEVAAVQQQAHPSYFAEKFNFDHRQQVIEELYPQAREIILVRDFRDVYCSILAFNAKRGTVEFSRNLVGSDAQYAYMLAEFAHTLLEHWQNRAWRPLLVRYEDLVIHPLETLREIFTYLDLDISASTLDQILIAAAAEDPVLNSHRTTSSVEASIGRWKVDLDETLRAVCQEAFADVLAAFGYDTQGKQSDEWPE